jgi:hypothetical protein
MIRVLASVLQHAYASVDSSRRSVGDGRARRHEEFQVVEGIPDSKQCL